MVFFSRVLYDKGRNNTIRGKLRKRNREILMFHFFGHILIANEWTY